MKKNNKQARLVQGWNVIHPVVTVVIVTKDDGTEIRTKTRSGAYLLGAYREYPGHTAVIQLEGMSGCYALERVRGVS